MSIGELFTHCRVVCCMWLLYLWIYRTTTRSALSAVHSALPCRSCERPVTICSFRLMPAPSSATTYVSQPFSSFTHSFLACITGVIYPSFIDLLDKPECYYMYATDKVNHQLLVSDHWVQIWWSCSRT